MKYYDFEYRGFRLSDLGFTLCTFGSKGLQTIDNGSKIELHTVSTLNGSKFDLTNSEYTECLSGTFQICKKSCFEGEYITEKNMSITEREFVLLMQWLNSKTFHKLKLISDESVNNNIYNEIYYEATFNVSRIEMDGMLYGLELNVLTNRPFGLMESVSINESVLQNGTLIFNSGSIDEGYIYPQMTITLQASGDLTITCTSPEERIIVINNCSNGEVITFDYPIIQTSLLAHKIQNDFNWKFPRISVTPDSKINEWEFSLPCSVSISYSPIIKLGF